MKVTVCFGNTRVVVPCGEGNMTVSDLQKQACARYRKIIGQSPDYWLRVLQLGSAVDGGILDWDDLVKDVIEDKEKLIAVFEEEDPQTADWDLSSVVSLKDQHLQSRPTVKSPFDLTNGNAGQRFGDRGSLSSSYYSRDSSLEVDVGIETLKSADPQIVVRRETDMSSKAGLEREIAKSPIMSQFQSRYMNEKEYKYTSPHKHSRNTSQNSVSDEHNNNTSFSSSLSSERNYFKRDKFRQSMASGLAEPTDNGNTFYNDTDRDYTSQSKLFYSDIAQTHAQDEAKLQSFADRLNLPWFYKESQEVLLVNDGRPLGFQVASYNEQQSNKFMGLVVQSIVPGSRVEQENLLQCGDVIVEINHRVLLDLSADMAHAILKESLYYQELQFRILPVEELERHAKRRKPTNLPSLKLTIPSPPANASNLSNSQLSASASSMSTHESSSPTSTKVPLIAQQSYDNVSLYTRKIGNQINISLKKGPQGLGFSVTTRDTTTTDDPGPIYIKNILPKGAAIVDGRLRAGDRLLKVNDQELTGLSQEDAVKVLRSVPSSSVVNLVVSRQGNDQLPRKMQDDPLTDQIISEDNLREYFMYEIPLNDTGSAGLGISLKGNQSKKTGKDLGIFVKSVFHGGAAWQDGRLRANDQLVQVNGRSLTGVSNHEAIDILRSSMSTEGNVRGMIQMVIARRKSQADGLSSRTSEASSDLSDSILEHLHYATKTASEIEGDSFGSNFQDRQEDSRMADGMFGSFSSADQKKPLPTFPNHHDLEEGEDDFPPSYDPFQRESVVRQSVSEKRRDGVNRFVPNSDQSKGLKSKHGLDKAKKEDDSGRRTFHSKSPSSPISMTTSFSGGRPKTPSKNVNNSSSAGGHLSHQAEPLNRANPSFDNQTLGNGFRKSISTESLVAPAQPHSVASLTTGLPAAGADSHRRLLGLPVCEEGDSKITLGTIEDGGARSNKKRQAAKGTKLFGLFKINKPKRPNETPARPKMSENELHKQHLEARKERDFERMKEENERIQAKARELRNKQAEEQKRSSSTQDRPRPPSVPVTAMQRIRNDDPITWYKESSSGRHSVDPVAMRNRRFSPPPEKTQHFRYPTSEEKDQRPSAPPRSIKHLKKDEHRRFTDNVNTYGSLPRQPRRPSRSTDDEAPPSNPGNNALSETPLGVATAALLGSVKKFGSGAKFDNREFYNRQKPTSVRKKSPVSSPTRENPRLPSKDTRDETKGKTLFYDDTNKSGSRNPRAHEQSCYQREQSPEPPTQSFYVIQTSKLSSPGDKTVPQVVMRRSAATPASRNPRWIQPSNQRHSVYTESPSALGKKPFHQVRSPSFQSGPIKALNPAASRQPLPRSGSPTPLETAQNNREAFYRLMSRSGRQSGEDDYEKIEVSTPYNL